MIRLEGVSFSYGQDPDHVSPLRDVTMRVGEGEFVLLTGRSGCGKTTLTRILNGLAPQYYGGLIDGTYSLDGRNAFKMPIDEIGTMVGSVFQDPRSQFFASNTTDEMVLGMENNAVGREQMRERLQEVGTLLGIDPLLDKSLFPLSSGEKQRVAIASVCAMRPKVLVLDEPSANLDSDAMEQLAVLLCRLKERGMTIILSEHRFHYVKDLFDRMIVMEEGTISREYTREQARSIEEKDLERQGLRSFQATELIVGNSIASDTAGYLGCDHVSLSFASGQILNDVSFGAQKGRVLAIAGRNGAGKSSICRVVSGLTRQSVGTVRFDGRTLKKKKRVRESFFVQQDADYQMYAATVEDEFSIGRGRGGPSRETILERLESVGLMDVVDRNPLSLSGGQKQRLLLALAASWEKDVLVLDEPTSGLDGANMRLTADLISALAAEGRCVLLITHDIELLSLVADSVLYVESGSVSYHKRLSTTPMKRGRFVSRSISR